MAGVEVTCGSSAGYLRHYRAGEVPCAPCTDATAYDARWRLWRNGRRQTVPRCKRCGSVFPLHHLCGAP